MTDNLKFIKLKKNGQVYYYNCPNLSDTAEDCYKYMRSDLNRVLLNSVPTNYDVIDCGRLTPNEPCDLVIDTIEFLNTTEYPYDYTNKKGYVVIKIKDQVANRKIQYKITSSDGETVIMDWSDGRSDSTVAYKLECGSYRLNARLYDNITCSLSNISFTISCLTTTITSTTSKPCTLEVESATVINNSTYPYDYATQQGHIEVKIKNQPTGRKLQYKITSNDTVVMDWSTPTTESTSIFKLNCATYNLFIREYDAPSCAISVSNLVIPCLTTTATTTAPPVCTLEFDSVNFVNNEAFPYDYDTQKGYIEVKIKNQPTGRKLQYKIMSGSTVIKDWTEAITQSVVMFNLNCGTYKVMAREFNNISCVIEINNVTVSCLTTTTPTYTYTSCGVFGLRNQNLYFKSLVTGDTTNERLVTNLLNYATDGCISRFENKIYIPHKTDNKYKVYDIVSNSFVNKAFPNITGTPFDVAGSTNVAVTHDVSGSMYIAKQLSAGTINVYKFYASGGEYIFEKKVIDSFAITGDHDHDNVYDGSSPNYQLDSFSMQYINNLGSILMFVRHGIPHPIDKQYASYIKVIKADCSNLSYFTQLYYENEVDKLFNGWLYFKDGNINYMSAGDGWDNRVLYTLKLTEFGVTPRNGNTDTFTVTNMMNGVTQSPNCRYVTYNDELSLTDLKYKANLNGTYTYKFKILNGVGSYSYSLDQIAFNNISGVDFVGTFSNRLNKILLRENSTNKERWVYLTNDNPCMTVEIDTTTTSTTSTSSTSSTTSTTSTTTVNNCVDIYNATMVGNGWVYTELPYTYSLKYDGTTPISYNWSVTGGTIQTSRTSPTVTVKWKSGWNEATTPRRLWCYVGLCSGSSSTVDIIVHEYA